jgi:hypothetical protein
MEGLIVFSLKTVADDFPFVIYSECRAIGTSGRRNSSDLIADLVAISVNSICTPR